MIFGKLSKKEVRELLQVLKYQHRDLKFEINSDNMSVIVGSDYKLFQNFESLQGVGLVYKGLVIEVHKMSKFYVITPTYCTLAASSNVFRQLEKRFEVKIKRKNNKTFVSYFYLNGDISEILKFLRDYGFVDSKSSADNEDYYLKLEESDLTFVFGETSSNEFFCRFY